MRGLLIAGLGLVGLAGGAAAQGGPGAGYPVPGARVAPPPPMHVAPPQRMGGRWGGKVDGRWSGGLNAPGGLAAYRRPVRGAAVSTYWNSPRFYVTDWDSYGLPQPPAGYRWVRYYDDAVLLDARGSIYDTEFGVDWDRLDGPAIYAGDRMEPGTAYRSDGYASDGYGRSGYSTTVPAGGTHVVQAGPGMTTVTVRTQPAVTTTTTTTEYVDEAVTYSRAPKRVYRSKRLRR